MPFAPGNKLGKKFTSGNTAGVAFYFSKERQFKHPSQKGRIFTPEHRAKMSAAKIAAGTWKGENHPSWKGGITPELTKIRRSREYSLWRTAVFQRDNYTCVQCGDSKGGNLNADHIKPFAHFPDLRFAIDNGRTLCVPCHRKTDSYGGNGNKKRHV